MNNPKGVIAIDSQTDSSGLVEPRPLVSGSGLAFGLTRTSILVLMCGGAAIHFAVTFAQIRQRTNEWDFSHYYVSALAMRQGLNPYTTDLRPLGRQLGIAGIARATDTPFFLLCFEPLTLLRPAAAYWFWCALNLFALAAAIALIFREAGSLTRRQMIALVTLTALYPPVSNHFYYAQSQILILLLMVLTLRALRLRRPKAAGLIISAAALIKVFPLTVTGYLVVRRNWRVLGWVAVGLIAGTVAPIIWFGLGRTASFVTGAYLARNAGFLARSANIAIGSFVSRLFWYGTGDATLVPWLERTRVIAVCGAQILVLAATIFATRPSRENQDAGDFSGRAFTLWIVTAITIAPTAWIHYMVLLVLPFILIAAAGWNGRATPRAVWLMALSYLVLSVGMSLAGDAHRSLSQWPRVKTALEESGTLSLILAYLSAWFFAADAPRGVAARAHSLEPSQRIRTPAEGYSR
jgi:hypothetical protein